MGEYIIRGGKVLSGQVCVSGAKNAALPICAAAVLTQGAIIHNCPDLLDTRACMDILSSLGCRCDFHSGVVTVEPYGLNSCEINRELCRKMRSSITFLGALMGAVGEAVIYCPGGCALGKRPIDIHINALREMGCEITEHQDKIICRGKPKGSNIHFRYPSVGATENIILAAVRAKGITTIYNCAKEPEIVNLADFLNSAGAKIKGAGTATIIIEGVDKLDRCEFTVMGDRIEAGTYICAAAITGGEVFVKGVKGELLMPLIKAIKQTGCVIKESRDLIYVDAPKKLTAVKKIVTSPYPEFPTDMQPQLMAALTLARGSSIIEERVFEARNKHIEQLNKLGGNIVCENTNSFIINGVNKLYGTTVYAEDLRGGAALVLAALAAEGESCVKNAHYIQRGYESFEQKLADIGGEIIYNY